MRNINKLIGIILAAAILAGCGQIAGNDSAQTDDEIGPTTLTLPPSLDNLVQSRMIDRNVLFAEVKLRYDDIEETVSASRDSNSEVWEANFKLPMGQDFSLEVTWYDTADGERLNLVRLNRDFGARFESGPVTFEFNDYDFDGYDDDDDGMTNLAERQAGTSPTGINNSIECPVIPAAESNVNSEPMLTYENPVQFTDDFDNGLPRYVSRFFGSADAETSLSVANGTATLSVTGDLSDGGAANIEPVVVDDPDSLFVRVQIPQESTTVSSQDNSTDSRFRIRGSFFNSISDGGVTDPEVNSRTGDVELTLSIRNHQDGQNSDFLYCAQVIGENGSAGFFVDLTEDGDGDGCSLIETLPVDLEFAREYLLGIGVNRETGEVFFQVDDTRRSAIAPSPILGASNPYMIVSVAATGNGVLSRANVSEIQVDGNIDTTLGDLEPDIIRRYNNLNRTNSRPNESIIPTSGQVELRGISQGGNTFTNLSISGDTDFVAADLALSSDTRINNTDGNATVRIGGVLYNDLSNNGPIDSDINGTVEGDVRATLEILSRANGSTVASACLLRFQADEANNVCSLVSETSFCLNFDTAIQTDVSYRTSIELDRVNSRVLFRLDDNEIIHNIETNIFLPGSGEKSVSTRIRGDGSVVGIVDNLTTINPNSL